MSHTHTQTTLLDMKLPIIAYKVDNDDDNDADDDIDNDVVNDDDMHV